MAVRKSSSNYYSNVPDEGLKWEFCYGRRFGSRWLLEYQKPSLLRVPSTRKQTSCRPRYRLDLANCLNIPAVHHVRPVARGKRSLATPKVLITTQNKRPLHPILAVHWRYFMEWDECCARASDNDQKKARWTDIPKSTADDDIPIFRHRSSWIVI